MHVAGAGATHILFSVPGFCICSHKITYILDELLPKSSTQQAKKIEKPQHLTIPSLFVPFQPPDPDNMLGSSQDGRALPVSG